MMRWFTTLIIGAALLFGCIGNKTPQTLVEPQKITQVQKEPTVEEQLAPFFYTVPKIIEQYVYAPVGRIDSEEGLIGSGVYIGNRMVLTAGHVLHKTNAKYFSVGEYCYDIVEVVVHPGFVHTPDSVDNDIAIAILKEEPGFDIQAAKVCSKLSLKKGDCINTVGYSFGKKKLSKPCVFFFYGVLMEEPQFLKFLPIFATVFFGDSGGGVFDSKGNLVGIISYFSLIGNRPYEDSAVRVDYYFEWICDVESHVLKTP